MRQIKLFLVMTGVLAAYQGSAAEPPSKSSGQSVTAKVYGPYPRRGDLNDVLACAGANERLWTTLIRQNPYSAEAHQAMRKASWYATIAMNVYEVDTQVVRQAITEALAQEPVFEVFEFARQCRDVPEHWHG